MKQRVIEFAADGTAIPDIKPSKNSIPSWYKDIPTFNKKNIVFNDGIEPFKNVKSCVPFLDAINTGYTVTLWSDVYCTISDTGNYNFRWTIGPDPILYRGKNKHFLTTTEEFTDDSFAWQSPYCFKLPQGYSAIVTHPFNRHDLPFTTLTGVVDADDIMTSGNVPFLLKKGFTGIIEIGTPLFQIIPFKREPWKAERNEELLKIANDQKISSQRKFFNYYRDKIWKKKEYL